MCLDILGKVDILEFYHDREVRSSSGSYPVPAVVRARKHVRVSKKKTALTRRNLMTRDNHQCQYCLKHLSSRHVTLDHVLPRSRGGRNNWENLVICCLACNLKKANRLPAEAGMKLAKTPVEPNHQMPLPYLRNPNTPLPREWEPFLASLPYPVSFA
jgi:5-methylcytosine-specific restriction endonuclease McrA